MRISLSNLLISLTAVALSVNAMPTIGTRADSALDISVRDVGSDEGPQVAIILTVTLHHTSDVVDSTM
ncbi:hypothetical protein QCA50_004395 [Cerrena zonata]|uniref:Uncharacterized protein n=1 Tax=Cerrena zonata TaxID=2478898 RepID=A0AAW0GLF9_9APHY